MKNFYTTIIIALLSMNVFGQAPTWAWAKSAGGTSFNFYQNSVATDASGNVYATGNFSSATDVFGTTTLTNAGSEDMYLVKYDASGTVIWAKSAGGTGDDAAFSVTTDVSGNVYVTGHFKSPTIVFGTTTLTNAGGSNYDMFIVKYDTGGNVLWAKRAGGTGYDEGVSVTIDPTGAVYVTGNFDSFTMVAGSTTLTNTGSADMFLIKYDAAGAILWAKSATGTGFDGGYSIAADASGVYITGTFSGLHFTIGTTTLTNADASGTYPDIFVAKYDASGTILWAQRAGGNDSDYGNSIAVDAFGNTYLTGRFSSSTASFNSITITNSGANYDMYIVKYDASGNAIWARSAGGSGVADYGQSVAVNSFGVYVVGYFESSSITFGTTALANSGSTNIYIVKYDTTGAVGWATSAGGNFVDYGFAIALNATNDIYVTGYFRSPTIVFGSTTLTNIGTSTLDMYFAKVKNNCFAYYTASYDSISNNFTLTVDTATVAMAVGYHWDFGDGTSSTLAYPTHSYAVDSLYNVCMKIYTAAGDSCEYCHIIGIDSLGHAVHSPGFTLNVLNGLTVNAPKVSNESRISIYPNPFTSTTTITFSEEQKNTMIKITDLLGQTIQELTTNNQQLTIDMSSYAKGIYFVRIEDEKKNIINRKIIKQ